MIPPAMPGGGHPMSVNSLKLELLYFSEENQQALDTGYIHVFMQVLGQSNIHIFREQVCIKSNG